MYKYSTCFQPFSWFKVSMGTLVEQGIIVESRMLVNSMIKVLNFAQMTRPSPLKVDVALQWRCLSHGFIHSDSASQSFILAIFDRTFRISVKRHDK